MCDELKSVNIDRMDQNENMCGEIGIRDPDILHPDIKHEPGGVDSELQSSATGISEGVESIDPAMLLEAIDAEERDLEFNVKVEKPIQESNYDSDDDIIFTEDYSTDTQEESKHQQNDFTLNIIYRNITMLRTTVGKVNIEQICYNCITCMRRFSNDLGKTLEHIKLKHTGKHLDIKVPSMGAFRWVNMEFTGSSCQEVLTDPAEPFCEDCLTHFQNVYKLKRHLCKPHYYCQVCNKRFDQCKKLWEHYSHSKTCCILRCECGYFFESVELLVQHKCKCNHEERVRLQVQGYFRRNRDPLGTYVCEGCNLDSKACLNLKPCLAVRERVCHLCNIYFKQENWYMGHMKRNHLVRILPRSKVCIGCNDIMLTTQPHVCPMGRNRHACSFCPERFPSVEQLNKHLIKNGYPITCPECSVKIKPACHYARHMYMNLCHTEYKVYMCTLCEYMFYNMLVFETHVTDVHKRREEDVQDYVKVILVNDKENKVDEAVQHEYETSLAVNSIMDQGQGDRPTLIIDGTQTKINSPKPVVSVCIDNSDASQSTNGDDESDSDCEIIEQVYERIVIDDEGNDESDDTIEFDSEVGSDVRAIEQANEKVIDQRTLANSGQGVIDRPTEGSTMSVESVNSETKAIDTSVLTTEIDIDIKNETADEVRNDEVIVKLEAVIDMDFEDFIVAKKIKFEHYKTEFSDEEHYKNLSDDYEDDLIMLDNSQPELTKRPEEIKKSPSKTTNIAKANCSQQQTYGKTCRSQCNDCGLRMTERHLKIHMETNYCNGTGRNTKYSCQHCGVEEYNLYQYIHHWQNHGMERASCLQCGRVLLSYYNLQKHVRRHIRELYDNESNTCRKCKQRFNDDKTEMCLHWEQHLLEEKTTNRLRSSQKIILCESEPEIKLETDCEVGKQLLRIAVKRKYSHDKKVYNNECVQCGKKMYRLNDFKRHLIEHLLRMAQDAMLMDSSIPLTCLICQRTFNVRASLKNHLRVHAALTLYKCNLCEQVFSCSSNYCKHKKVHGLSVLQCDLCKRKFNDKRRLEEHMIQHTYSQPSECNHCGRKFDLKTDLRRHMKRHKKVVNHCRVCLFTCDSYKDTMIHMWEKHQYRLDEYNCPRCHKQFRMLSQLNRHIRIIECTGEPLMQKPET